MSDISVLGMATAFAAGTVSFLSPCVLPLVPGYVSYVAGHTFPHSHHEERPVQRLSALALSRCFVLGFSTVFMILGASATVLGRPLQVVAGIIMMIMGLAMITGQLSVFAL